MELGKKGIDKNIIEDVLEETPVDEEKMAKELLAKRAYKWDSLDAKTAKQNN
jgi:SOS response regulatory protein OraA/RecX